MSRPRRIACALSILSYHLDYVTPSGNFNRSPEDWHWPNQTAALHYTWAISPTMVNEASVTGTADHITINYDNSMGELTTGTFTGSITRTCIRFRRS